MTGLSSRTSKPKKKKNAELAVQNFHNDHREIMKHKVLYQLLQLLLLYLLCKWSNLLKKLVQVLFHN